MQDEYPDIKPESERFYALVTSILKKKLKLENLNEEADSIKILEDKIWLGIRALTKVDNDVDSAMRHIIAMDKNALSEEGWNKVEEELWNHLKEQDMVKEDAFITHEWGVQWEESDRAGRAIRKEKIFNTQKKRDDFATNVEEKDNFISFVAWLEPNVDDVKEDATISSDIAIKPERVGEVKRRTEPDDMFGSLPVFDVEGVDFMRAAKIRQDGSRYNIKNEKVNAYLRENGYRKGFGVRWNGNVMRIK